MTTFAPRQVLTGSAFETPATDDRDKFSLNALEYVDQFQASIDHYAEANRIAAEAAVKGS